MFYTFVQEFGLSASVKMTEVMYRKKTANILKYIP